MFYCTSLLGVRFRTLLSGLLVVCALFCCFLFSSTVEARASTSYRTYRNLRRSIYKRYRHAVQKRSSLPCRARNRLKQYRSWLTQFRNSLKSSTLKRRYRRDLLSRSRQYLRISRYRIRWCRRRCRRFWKAELKRAGSKGLRASCASLQAKSPSDGVQIWIGVRPWGHVYINGKLCGMAPLKAHLKPREYTIRVSFPPGQDEYTRRLQLVQGQQPVLIARHMRQAPKASRSFPNMLSPKQLAWTVRKYKGQFQSCRLFQMSVHVVKLAWNVQRDGKTKDVRWLDPAGASTRFQSCILRAAQRMHFPKLKNVARIQSYSISLK